ncbi:hypothetical protein K438DRAFT_1787324 [Mycena galopus ATCC 62051]|nr:hypothetical protein K438DRAFT_1787324 [Mycena galopus ATCC 62051]
MTSSRRLCHLFEALPLNACARSSPSPTTTQSSQRSIYLPQYFAELLQPTYLQDLQNPLKTLVLFIRASPPNTLAQSSPSLTPPQNPAPQRSIYLPQYLTESLQPTYPKDFPDPLKMLVQLDRGLAPERARVMVAKPDTHLLAQSVAHFSAIYVGLQIRFEPLHALSLHSWFFTTVPNIYWGTCEARGHKGGRGDGKLMGVDENWE